MSDQQTVFVFTRLEWKLQERLADALKYINSLCTKDVLGCDDGCLKEIVRQFAVAPPILRLDLMVADERIGEAVDLISEQTTGHTNHSIFIPVEREPEWLEEVDSQRVAPDGPPLAFLDRKRAWIDIRLMLSPEDDEGALKLKRDHRTSLVKQYADSVTAKIVEFNEDLAEKMTTELNRRKSALVKAEKELEDIGLPQVYNPAHAETAVHIERVLQGLRTYMTAPSSDDEETEVQELRPFIVHGHDHHSLYELKDYLQNTLKLGEPVVLRNTPGLGKTIIEKFEREAEAVELVFVLLTPDDEVASGAEPNDEKRRARQNVILELGFFLGKLGRKTGKILLLYKEPCELPSDIAGIEYIDITNGLKSAGDQTGQ